MPQEIPTTTISAALTEALWSTVKKMRDEAMSLGRDRLAAELLDLLRRMSDEGMAAHLPTIEVMRGLWADD